MHCVKSTDSLDRDKPYLKAMGCLQIAFSMRVTEHTCSYL